MLKFRKFNEKSIKLVQKYTSKSNFLVCDLSGGVLFMWNDHYNVSYAVYNETLILRSDFSSGESAFFLPIGKDFSGALSKIEEYCVQKELPLNFMCVEEEYLPLLSNRYAIKSDTFHRNWSDYLYNYEDIVNFAGKKYSGQRNHINAFKKNYSYNFKPLTNKDIPKIKNFLKEYKKEHKGGGKIERREFNNTLKLLDNYSKGEFTGAYIEIDRKVRSFTVGEYTGKNLIIHIEKGLRQYRGIYPTTFQEFSRLCKKEGVIYINREDDSGDLGLRTSKLQYHPAIILNKHYLEIEKPMKIKRYPTLKGKKVTLDKITEEDKALYYKLCYAKALNKYWGYDYKKDIPNPTEEAFFNAQRIDFKNKNCLSLAIRNKTREFMGEVVLHHFDYEGKVELGVRLLKKYHGNGYATEAISLAIKYAEKLGLTPVAKCYKQNEKSLNCLKRAGLEVTGEDNKFYYLKKF